MKHGEYLAKLMIIHQKKNPSNIDAKAADKSIKVCTECKRCWQLVFSGWGKKRVPTTNYYYDFPSYGKEKKICEECEEK